MQGRLAGLLSGMALAACASAGSTPPPLSASTSGAPSASAAPSTSASAVPARLNGYLAVWSGYPAQRLMLIDAHGTVLATASPWAPGRSRFRDPPLSNGPGTGDSDLMPYFSSSRTRLYYLDGDGNVRFLAIDGRSGLAKSLPVRSLQHAGFAVSPDDRTIAVSLIDYSVTPHRITVYTEDLSGSAGHRVLYTSTTRFAWPIGFVGDQILMAVGPTGSQSGTGDPYGAYYGYALLDRSGTFTRRLCAPNSNDPADYGTARGPVDPDGATCDSSSGRVLQAWSGAQTALHDRACGADPVVEYSPDRRFILCSGMRVVDVSGHELVTHTAHASDASDVRFSWIDDFHVVIGMDIVDIRTGASAPLTQATSVMWRVPGDIYLRS